MITAAWAQPDIEPSKKPELLTEKPSAVVQKHYRCHGGKALSVRYQLGARSVHAFVRLQGKTRELPWDGDYKLAHEAEDERFSDGRYELLVQGNFSRVVAVRRLPAKASGKPRDLYRACTLKKSGQTANASNAAATQLRAKFKPTPSPKPSTAPTLSPSPAAQDVLNVSDGQDAQS